MSIVQPADVPGSAGGGGGEGGPEVARRASPATRRSPLAPAYYLGRPAELWISIYARRRGVGAPPRRHELSSAA
jgi:hypothetical protein